MVEDQPPLAVPPAAPVPAPEASRGMAIQIVEGPNVRFGAAIALWLLIATATMFGAHSCAPARVQAELKQRVEAALSAADAAYVSVEMRGQMAVLSGVAPSLDAKEAASTIALKAAGSGGPWAGGVSRVENQIIVAAVVSPYTWSATREAGGVRLRGHAPSRAARAALYEKAKAAFTEVADETAVAPGAPGGEIWGAVAADALAQLAKMSTGAVRLSDRKLTIVGEAEPAAAAMVRVFYGKGAPGGFIPLVDLTAPGEAVEVPGVAGVKLTANAPAAACQSAFAGLLSRNVINFDTGSAMVSATSRQILDDLARVARRCDQYSVEIAGHTDDRGDRAANMKLSRARAEAVVRYLIDQGVAPDRLEAAGFGPDRPRSSNRSPAGQAQNRRIEFTVKS